ncbi:MULTISPECIES: hypothetical protein [unclassified Massilia]|uniref:hypothetical protein n=1 Tax=unclassified Massilia TaxID=2609279 RepID=UPI001780A0D3|nr:MULTISPECIES: hypothetical protein [unclassified Massilia]MBD8531552.1 hypothetical protein [Massilia sp. CFBP 13647]MBD8673652.1 hypothetical protein [Massilia sp. CFBP 13721]
MQGALTQPNSTIDRSRVRRLVEEYSAHLFALAAVRGDLSESISTHGRHVRAFMTTLDETDRAQFVSFYMQEMSARGIAHDVTLSQ